MGLLPCEGEYYEVATNNQKYLYIALSLLYILAEVFYTFQTIWVLKKVPSIYKSKTLVFLYGMIHILMIRNICSFLGGSWICYNKIAYYFVTDYLYIIKDFIHFIMGYRISSMYSNAVGDSSHNNTMKILVVAAWIIDVVILTVFFILTVTLHWSLGPIYLHNCLFTIALALVIDYPLYYLLKLIKHSNKINTSSNDLTIWKVFLIAINASFVIRITVMGVSIAFFYSDKYKKYLGYLEYTVAMVFYYILSELAPFAAIIWVLASGTKKSGSNGELTDTEDAASIATSSQLTS